MSESTIPAPTVGATVHHVESDGKAGPALAHGILLGPRTLLVPDPPRTVGDPWQSLAVRITVAPDPGDGTEALRVAGISLAAFATDDVRAAAAFLTLLTPSRHAPAPGEVTRDRLNDTLRQYHGDLWAAHAALGYPVRPPERATPPEPWWSDIPVEGFREFDDNWCCLGSNTSCCRELQL
ncbi:hypothetical protein DR950_26885 [Kitasatospora xanthocidica]|uniref:Uncharacterized protein n=1 Tax=Kitasatospora xanthocidica TaxID=83382 RepID=A0A372ZYP5_9ACTN|nr:hypothetical protein [Kitasatospora xanthocidica]RGD60911.1 hypothetical protein DR950_26885 [Kitasatospora xanthocidica]